MLFWKRHITSASVSHVPCTARYRIFCTSYHVNSMAVDVLAPSGAKSAASIILITQDRQDLDVFFSSFRWRLKWLPSFYSTHCGLVMPYGDIELGQHWLVVWQHQAITWTSVDLSWVRSTDIHLRAISQVRSQPSITEISFNSLWPSDTIWR